MQNKHLDVDNAPSTASSGCHLVFGALRGESITRPPGGFGWFLRSEAKQGGPGKSTAYTGTGAADTHNIKNTRSRGIIM